MRELQKMLGRLLLGSDVNPKIYVIYRVRNRVTHRPNTYRRWFRVDARAEAFIKKLQKREDYIDHEVVSKY